MGTAARLSLLYWLQDAVRSVARMIRLGHVGSQRTV